MYAGSHGNDYTQVRIEMCVPDGSKDEMNDGEAIAWSRGMVGADELLHVLAGRTSPRALRLRESAVVVVR
jgi:hypothetical protein